MSIHIFANIVTDFGTAANNRGETEGNATTLQKLIWQGGVHTTVSAEAIRFATRQALSAMEKEGTNRNFDEKQRVCLLYTSPSPRDATLSRMPSSA